jgi:hypothetical protein
MAEWQEVFQDHMPELLAALCASGFEPPLYCTCMDGNGSMAYGRYEDNEDRGFAFTLVTSHMEAEDFVLPMHVTLVDQYGESAHVALEIQYRPPARWN